RGRGSARGAVREAPRRARPPPPPAELIRLDSGGWVVDTPGVRQFQLWKVQPGEVEGLFPEFRPFVALCAFPDCTHTHEARCAVKRAVARRQVAARRYHSYIGLVRDASGA